MTYWNEASATVGVFVLFCFSFVCLFWIFYFIHLGQRQQQNVISDHLVVSSADSRATFFKKSFEVQNFNAIFGFTVKNAFK